MSNTETKQLRGSRQRRPANSQAAAVDTQISIFFPKSDDPTEPVKTRVGRKRTAEVPVGPTASSSDVDDQLTSTSTDAAKRTLRENIQKIQSNVPPEITDKQKDTMISKFFQRDQNDDDDDDDMAFESPKKKPKPPTKVAAKRTRVTKPKQTTAAKSKQPSAKNMIRERFFSDVMAQHSARDGVDSDELQMALALSRSMAQQQQEMGADQATKSAAANPKTKNTTKEKAVFEIFQNFGFREGYKEFDPADFVTKPKVARKCNRYACKVTALTRRLNAVQLQKLRARLAHIGRHYVRPTPDTPAPCAVYQMTSEYLARFYIPQRDLVELNGTADRQPLAAFYTNNLCEVSAVRAGALLRSWAEIPGRDRSPQREDGDADRPMLSLPLVGTADGAIQSSGDVEMIAMSGESAEVAEILESVANSNSTVEQRTEPVVTASKSNNSSMNETKRCESRASRQTRYWTAALDRSASPDMFASDSDGEDGVARELARPRTTSPPSSPCLSSDPARCSLDPESTTNEEDRLIELYDQVAKIRRLTRTPSKCVAAQSSSSSSCDGTVEPSVAPALASEERTSLQLVYSGDSEQESQCHMLVSSGDGGGDAAAVQRESSSSFVTACSSELQGEITSNRNDGPLVRSEINVISSSPDAFEDAVQVQEFHIKNEPSVSFGCSQEPVDPSSDDELSVGPTLMVDACNNTALCVVPQKCAYSPSFEPPEVSALERFDVSDEAKISDDNRDMVSPIIIEFSDNSEPMEATAELNSSPRPIQTEVSTDNIDFSFDSIASDLEETFQRPPSAVIRQLGLSRQVLEKSITSKLMEKSRIIESIELSDDEEDSMPDAQNELFVMDRSCNITEENASLNAFVQCLNQSQGSETKDNEKEKTEYTRQDENERPPITENIANITEDNTSLNALIQSSNEPKGDSIEIFDDEDDDRPNPTDDVNFSFPSQVDQQFEFSVNLSTERPPAIDKSIEISDDDISDDEINYSMSHGRGDLPTTPCRRSRVSQPVDTISCTNESLQQIFDDDDGFDIDADPCADEALLNQSVQTIVRHEFVAQSSGRKESVASQRGSTGTKFRRYMSDVSGTTLAKSDTAPKSPAIIEADDDVDEFDRMLCPKLPEQQTQLPKPKRKMIQTLLSPPKDLKFTVSYDQRTYDVKIGPRSVTPKPDFEAMDSPTRDSQLRRFGLTQLSRRRAIICLEHIYNRMHPFVQVTDGVLTREHFESTGIAQAVQQSRSEGTAPTKPPPAAKPKVIAAAAKTAVVEPPDEPDDGSGLKLFAVSNPSIADTLPYDFFVYFLNQQSDYYLPSPPRGKRPWCLQPLHIAWYNMLHDNPRAYEHVLQYRPIELRTVRTHFKELGMLYDVNDLIAFFDKHCITFRTESTRTKRAASKK